MRGKPFIIGITGNIASGKSVVRNYLANFGAFTIDADLTAKDSYLPGTPAWRAILDHFGEDLCMADGQINRSKLGMIVLNDPLELRRLEEIVHPYVTQAIIGEIEQCTRPVLAVEAIKLLESEVAAVCDQIWTVAADEEIRLQRLVELRGHSQELAWEKIKKQPPQEDKLARSNEVIWSNHGFEETYQQTELAVQKLGLPLVRKVERQPLCVRSMTEADMQRSCDLISARIGGQGWTCDRIYRILGGKLIPVIYFGEEMIQVRRLSNRQNLALLTHQAPLRTEHTSNSVLQPLLEDWLSGAYTHLAVSKQVLSVKEAWEGNYSPGEDTPDGIPELIYASFLKENGLMPGEVWVKSLLNKQENHPHLPDQGSMIDNL